MKNKTCGKILIPLNLFPEKHELDVASFFKKIGKDVEFLMPVYVRGMRTPDIQMDGVLWEIKSPQGTSRRTIENNYRTAEKQAQNIIFDLHRIPINETKAIAQIKQQFKLRHKKIKRLLIITKGERLIALKR